MYKIYGVDLQGATFRVNIGQNYRVIQATTKAKIYEARGRFANKMNIVASSNLAVGQYPFEHKAAMLGPASLLFPGLSLRVDTMDIRIGADVPTCLYVV